MSTQQPPWEKAAILLGGKGTESMIKAACLEYAAQVEKERDGLRLELAAYKSVIDRICDLVGDAEHRNENVAVGVERVRKERDSLRARVVQMREALEEVKFHHEQRFSNTTKEQVEAALLPGAVPLSVCCKAPVVVLGILTEICGVPTGICSKCGITASFR